jgi:hypothetical protein
MAFFHGTFIEVAAIIKSKSTDIGSVDIAVCFRSEAYSNLHGATSNVAKLATHQTQKISTQSTIRKPFGSKSDANCEAFEENSDDIIQIIGSFGLGQQSRRTNDM